MSCGCGKKGASYRKPTPNGIRVVRPTVGPQSVQGGPAAGASPAELRALGLQNNTSPKQGEKTNADKRRIEKLRREAVRKALNK